MGSCIIMKHAKNVKERFLSSFQCRMILQYSEMLECVGLSSSSLSLECVGLSFSSLSLECYYYKFKCNVQSKSLTFS